MIPAAPDKTPTSRAWALFLASVIGLVLVIAAGASFIASVRDAMGISKAFLTGSTMSDLSTQLTWGWVITIASSLALAASAITWFLRWRNERADFIANETTFLAWARQEETP